MRNDIHRPSVLVPTDYKYLGMLTLRPHVLREEDRGFKALEGMDLFSENLTRCDVCGNQNWLDGVAYLHKPSGKVLTMGHQCAESLELAVDRGFLRVQRDRAADLRAAKLRRAEGIAKLRKLVEEQPEVVEALRIGRDDSFVGDVRRKASRGLSDAQCAAVVKAAEKIAQRQKEASEAPPKVDIPDALCDGQRHTVTGEVLGTKTQDGMYGTQFKMLLRVPAGQGAFTLWSTIPSKLMDSVDSYINDLKGREVTIKTKVQVSDDDPSFGFTSRPFWVE